MAFAQFQSDRRGSMAVMFAVGIFIILLAVGGAIDFVRLADTKTDIQEAADAALLAAVRAKLSDPTLTDPQVDTIANDMFALHVAGEATLSNINFRPIPNTEKFEITADATIPTLFLKAGGYGDFVTPVDAEATVIPGGPVEVVMALDNTGSIGSTELAQLKVAANLLVDKVMSTGPTVHKVGLVPFAQYVHLGPSYAGEPWLSPATFDEDGTPGVGSWYGCVGSRNSPLDTTDGLYTTPVPRLDDVDANDGCPAPIQALTNNRTLLETRINSMTTQGYTYLPSALMWAMRLISSDAPFTEGLSYTDLTSQRGIKAIVLMSDGSNTRSPNYPGHTNGSQAVADTLTIAACDAIKAENIRLYTVAFDISDSATRTMLENCASADGGYYAAANTDALTIAFSKIASDITEIVISR